MGLGPCNFAAVAKLKPSHRTALAFLKEARGELEPDCLEAAMVTAGHAPPKLHKYSPRNYPWSQDLIHRGIALATDRYGPTSLDSYSSAKQSIFSDDRLLKYALEPEIAVLDIEADHSVEVGIQRPPGSVVLDVLAVLQAIEKTGGIGFTQAGMPRIGDMKKLRRELRWTDSMKIDGLPVPNLTEAVVTALNAVGVLQPSASGLRLADGMLVYIDKASPAQLAFAERIAERQGHAQRHVAQYILTRNSVYGALENGYALDAILNELAKGAERDVPTNVQAEIRGWSERREQIVIRRHATLLEFIDEAGRRTAIETGAKGVEVGDRFLLVGRLDGKTGASVRGMAKNSVFKFDYTRSLPPCVEVSENGRLRLAEPHPDLLIRSQLDTWAECLGNDAWQLNEGSVRAAVKRNRSAEELLGLLDSRAIKAVPHFLQLALKALGGCFVQSPARESDRVALPTAGRIARHCGRQAPRGQSAWPPRPGHLSREHDKTQGTATSPALGRNRD